MAPPALFVGVVSHEGSRFASSRGPEGLAQSLARALPDVAVHVNTENLLETLDFPIEPRTVQEALTAELRLEREWSEFLGRPMGLRRASTYLARWVKRSWLRVRPPSAAMIRRLLNIELSHVDLMQRGLAIGSPWVLIVEDDAFAPDLRDLAQGVAGILKDGGAAAYINISQSFTPRELGVEHLLRAVDGCRWNGSIERAIFESSMPITNTVCALLYSRSFLKQLVKVLAVLPMEPVVPIDWKLNLALMRMFQEGRIRPGECWLVEPAPIVQMSMQPTAILPS